MANFTIKWYGDDIKNKGEAAAAWAINKTLADCVKSAKDNHESIAWKNRTATLEGSIQMRVAEKLEGVITGIWGFFNVLYGKFQELGTSKMRARPILRPTADAIYPRLQNYLKEAFNKK